MNFEKYKKSILIIQIKSLIPEKFINLLWKKGVIVKNIKKQDITSFILEVSLKDFPIIEEAAKRTKTRIKIINRNGLDFLLIKMKKRIALFGGFLLFATLIYVLSTFVWHIDITCNKGISPYEIRQELIHIGVKPGINRYYLNVNDIEEKLIRSNENIMWVRVRVEGARLKVDVSEKQSPPVTAIDDTACNLVASKDGEVVRIYTKAGTPVVKKGDFVKKGQLLVKGEQGKEGATYLVHAEGDVICNTFYEEIKEVSMEEVKRNRTGNKAQEISINIKGKQLYLKKPTSSYDKYDKIENNKFFINIVTYYEIKETKSQKDVKKLVEDTSKELYLSIEKNLNKNVKIVDKKINYDKGECLKIKALLVGEENIAVSEKIQ